MLRFIIGLTALLLLTATPAWSDPGSYPEYAKVEVSDKIAIRYIRVEELVQHILDRKPLTLLDVRQPMAFAAGHIKGARSVPLGSLYRSTDGVPKEGFVVLY